MRRIRKMTDKERARREAPIEFVDGCVTNGCVPMDEYSEILLESLADETVEFDALGYGTDQESFNMPLLKYNDDFQTWRNKRIALIQTIEDNGQCLAPWEILKALPQNRKSGDQLYFSQQSLGSCMSHADHFAMHSTTLIQIGLGYPFNYDPFNPVVTFGIIKGNLIGGLDVASMYNGSNKLGHYPIKYVGDDNTRMPSNYKQYITQATGYQAAVMFLDFRGTELADEIIQCCRAGLAVPFGNSNAVSGSVIDKKGLPVAVIGGKWAHATHFTYYRIVNGIEYVFWVNSHGPRYRTNDESCPQDGCWMTREMVEQMCSTMSQYGSPYVLLPESTWIENRSLVTELSIPFPTTWRR